MIRLTLPRSEAADRWADFVHESRFDQHHGMVDDDPSVLILFGNASFDDSEETTTYELDALAAWFRDRGFGPPALGLRRGSYPYVLIAGWPEEARGASTIAQFRRAILAQYAVVRMTDAWCEAREANVATKNVL
ncbi:MAG TPA: hypothetical protein VH120_09725 [Gemmataceae bacterium]|jgi:hypothetical protein|nr:hypothetical protein [Gemmataceae bacterium]